MLWCRTLLSKFKRWTIILLFEIERNLLFASFHWQFFAHPVMYNLMRKKWFGPFGKMERSSWLEVGRWTWLFLNIWCLFDIVFFPFLFTLFYIKHRINKVMRRSKGNIFWLAICKGNSALLSTIFFLCYFLAYQILQHPGAIMFPYLKELFELHIILAHTDLFAAFVNNSSLCPTAFFRLFWGLLLKEMLHFPL